ncbi:MAG: CocE/NonD family hydrolase [Novosphingobium sp.]|nr:CocE/NonD family hydrolase [Novosphingobium sp.]
MLPFVRSLIAAFASRQGIARGGRTPGAESHTTCARDRSKLLNKSQESHKITRFRGLFGINFWPAPIATLLLLTAPLAAQDAPIDAMANDKIGTYDWVRPQADFIRREVMIPMRDGVKLYTVIVCRRGTKDAPILLSRTPYDAALTTMRNRSQKIEEILPVADAEFVDDGYIRVYQDVRGINRSEGDYVMARPLRGPLNKTRTDHSTDAYDTIDWLVNNVKITNGKVGIIGSSYLGFTALMATIDPHPALKAAVPQSPMVDGWIGDDWFHNGAFRPFAFDYIMTQAVARGGGPVPVGTGDQYASYLAGGSAANFARIWGIDQLPAVRKLIEHPAYDARWQNQAVDRLLAARPLTVPLLLVAAQWDQEDSYGAFAVYRALQPKDTAGTMVHLALGPWRHSGVNFDGAALGPLKFEGDTAQQFRTRWMKPFLDCHLKTSPPACDTPPVVSYATGQDRWTTEPQWPASQDTPLYLAAGSALTFTRSEAGGADEYISDPAKPVPMLPRPVRFEEATWKTWLVQDQRFAEGRPDVLTYSGPVLDKPIHIRGAPRAELHAATTGRDSDWVVKLIDVFPREQSADAALAGYELPLGIEIFRGRYVGGFAAPVPLEPGRTYAFQWSLPNVDHVFLPGHRIMVQVQSSLFPVYDRNPQSWVPSIMDAKPEDYVKATQTVRYGGSQASAVWLPIVKE